MSHCAAQWHKRYVPLCSTVVQAKCHTVQHSSTSNMSQCAAQWHKQYVLLCSTVAQAICPTVQHSGTSVMSHCAAQWYKRYVLLCSTVAQASCPTVQHSGTSVMSHCAAQWHKRYVPLCSTVAQALCPTVQHSGTSNMSHCAAQWHKQYVCTRLGQILCNYEFACIHTVVASCCVTCRDLFYITLYCVTHHEVTLCIASDDAICKYRNIAICHAVSSTHWKSSSIQLLLRIIECSRTFWSRGHAFRVELASPRHVTISSSPRK